MIPGRDDVAAAAALIAGRARRTPVLELPAGALGVPHPLALKLESLQVAGSFKARGAFHALLARPPGPAGVAAASGGNHGLAVALAAASLGVRAEIFVPDLASPAKLALLRASGARVVQGGETYAEALAACEARRAETGAASVHAYDQPEVLAGQGTVALEFEEGAPGLTHVLVAVGGGGLIGGMAAWWSAGGPALVAVEPEGCPAFREALRAGRPVDAPVGGLAADSLGARRVGELAFASARRAVREAVLVSDEAIREAQRLLWSACRVAAEPGGAAALAALLSGAWTPPPGARVGVLVCGANLDPAALV